MHPSCYRWWIKRHWRCRHSRTTSPPSCLVIHVSSFYFHSPSWNTFPNNGTHARAHGSWACGHSRSSSIWRSDAAYFALFQTVCSPLSSRCGYEPMSQRNADQTNPDYKQASDGNNRPQKQPHRLGISWRLSAGSSLFRPPMWHQLWGDFTWWWRGCSQTP